MGTNASELGKTIAQLRRMGRLEVVDAARLQMVRSIARAVDRDPQNASLWRQYREALKELVRRDDDENDVDADLKALFGSVRDSPPA